MKPFLCLLLIFILAKPASSQFVKYDDCQEWDKEWEKYEVLPKFGNGKKDLQNYFDSSFKKRNLVFEAKVSVTIKIDSSGSPCCSLIIKGIDDQPDLQEADFQNIREIVNQMPRWASAKQNGHNINVTLNLQLSYADNKVTIL
jgi:hypothetical protein